MKHCFSIVGALLLPVLFACSAGIVTGHQLGRHVAAMWLHESSVRHSAVDVYSFYLPGSAVQAKGSFLNGKSGTCLAKQHHKWSYTAMAVIARLNHLILTKYQKETCAFPVRLRKADLIFPFHYFR